MKRIGLIGGVSWAATTTYYHHINTLVQASLGGNSSAELVVRSLNMQHVLDRMGQPAEVEAIVHQAASELAAAGAELIAVASLTGHRYVRCLEHFKVPFVGMERAIAAELGAAGKGRTGIFATSTALQDGVLMERLRAPGAPPLLLPSPDVQPALDAVIFGELAHRRLPEQALATLHGIAEQLIAQGATAILLGTTEFSLCAGRLQLPVPVLDATELHCRDLVAQALAAVPQGQAGGAR